MSTEARNDSIVLPIAAGSDTRVPSQWVFSRFPVRGGSRWRPQRLAWVGLLMSWDEGQTLHARWQHAQETAHTLHPHWTSGQSYGAFSAALVKVTPGLVPAVAARLRRQMSTLAEPGAQRCRWTALAVDGSRIETPHTLANEQGLGCAGRDKTAPQVYLTALWHMGLGVPWDFRVGPGTASERTHLLELLDDAPPGCLIVADAGFMGYDVCRQIAESGRFFLLRVGSNVTLLTGLEGEVEQRGDRVYLWPVKHRSQPPLVLRLIRLTRDTQTIYLLTNVLDAADLTDDEAGQLYERRWGVEVFYRSYKQTLDRSVLLSRTPDTCLAEAQWTFLGLWLLGLLTLARLPRQTDPQELSVAQARDAVRLAVRRIVCGRPHARQLRQQLSHAVRDRYERHGSKTARNYPRKKREHPPGPPQIKPASPRQIKAYQRLRDKLQLISQTA